MLFKINDYTLPTPAPGLEDQRYQLVDSGRNALGQVVAQKINRRQLKFDQVVFPHLTAAEWSRVLQEIDKFEGDLYYWDVMTMDFQHRKVYWGDASAKIHKIDPDTGIPTEYVNCQCNIIDMGY